MSEKFEAMLARLEPGASEVYQHIAIGSIAISLKRIADALAPTEGPSASQSLGESIYNAITQAELASRGFR